MVSEKDRQKMIESNLINGTVIDLGSQDMEGNLKESLHEFLVKNTNCKVIGVDIQKGEYVDVIADLNKDFPFKDNFAENIVAGEMIEHIVNPHHFLKECYRVLKPGGKLILTTPNATGTQILTGKESPYHYFVLSKRNLSLLMKETGFVKHSVEYFNLYFRRNLLLRGVGFLFPKLRPVLFAVAEKEKKSERRKNE